MKPLDIFNCSREIVTRLNVSDETSGQSAVKNLYFEWNVRTITCPVCVEPVKPKQNIFSNPNQVFFMPKRNHCHCCPLSTFRPTIWLLTSRTHLRKKLCESEQLKEEIKAWMTFKSVKDNNVLMFEAVLKWKRGLLSLPAEITFQVSDFQLKDRPPPRSLQIKCFLIIIQFVITGS